MSDDEDDGNPFRLPTDDQWYFFQEQEVLKKQAEIEKVKHQKVHEKTTSSQRIGASRGIYQVLPQLRPNYSAASLPRPESPSSAVGPTPSSASAAAAVEGPSKPPALTDRPPASADDARPRRRRRVSKQPTGGSSGPLADDRGATQDYVAKKHELFFVQMNLDAKKEEIQRLDQRANRREEAVRRSMKQLEEDHQRMQAFIDSNSVRASNALQAAQEMTQKKNNKLASKRQLKASLVVLQSEIAKLREHKDECMKLKSFLESVTPQEWIDARLEEKKERKRQRQEAWVDRQFQDSEAKMMAEIGAEVKAMEERNAEAMRGRRRPRREIEEEQRERERDLEVRKKRIQKKYPGREKFEADYLREHGDESSGEDLPLYFKEPRQLLDVFTSMEEANLFLIQNSQNTEQTLEELQQKNEEAKRNNAIAREKMDQQLELLEKQIEEEKEKSQYFKMKIKEQDTTSAQEALEQYLCDRAGEVYTACGYEAERDTDTLKMLAATEAKLEEYLGLIEEAETTGHAELVEQLEREKESARRAMVKQMRKEIQDRKTKERTQAALLRSQAPIHKRTRRQIMYRSPPGYTAQRVVVEDDGYEEAVREHTVFGIWTGKDGAANTAAPRKPAT